MFDVDITFGGKKYKRGMIGKWLQEEVESLTSEITSKANNIVASSADDHIRQLESLGIQLDQDTKEQIRRQYEE